MNRNQEVLARAAAARLDGAACRAEHEQWNRCEQTHAVALTQAAAAASAAPLLAICSRCLVTAECAAWAAADQYTGIAAGVAWVCGVTQPPHWVPGHPPKRLAS